MLDELQDAVTREAALMDAMSEAFAEDLADVYTRLQLRVRALLDQFEAEGGRLVSTQANLGRAIQLRNDLWAALRAAGYDGLIADAVGAPLDRLAADVLSSSKIANAAAKLTPVDVNALAAFKELRLADLVDVGDDLLRTVWRSILDGVVGLRPIKDLVKDIARATDLSLRQARTIYDTGISTYARQVDLLLSSGKPDERYVYVGPLDSLTRPFCRTWIGKVLERQEVEKLDNGQMPNPLITAGGYNCRHSWRRVSKFDAELNRLAETGDRAEWARAADEPKERAT
jgi:hypothetical protein